MKHKLLLLTVALALTSSATAQTLKDAALIVAKELSQSRVMQDADKQLVIEAVNFYSQVRDSDAVLVENELYLALSPVFREFKLMVAGEGIAGFSLNRAIQLKVAYEAKGEAIILHVRALKGLEGQLLTQTSVTFDADKLRRRTLVVVLDLESTDLNATQRKIYSDLFRSALLRINAFALASSADVDKMNPDAIQAKTGCSQDECAVIIGQQLGVDRVISSTYAKATDTLFYLSGKMLDIHSNAIVRSETVRHDGNLATLEQALADLALKLTKRTESDRPVFVPPTVRFSVIELHTNPSGAQVFMNDRLQLDARNNPIKTPIILRPAFGKHTFTFKLPDYRDKSVEVLVDKEDMGKQSFSLEKIPRPLIVSVPSRSTNDQHIVALLAVGGITLVSAILAQSEAQKYNDLDKENEALVEQYAQSTSSEEQQQLNEEYQDNQAQMKAHQSDVQFYNLITAAGIVWELYLFYSLIKSDSLSQAHAVPITTGQNVPRLAIMGVSQQKIGIHLQWRF